MYHLQGVCKYSSDACAFAHSMEDMYQARRVKKSQGAGGKKTPPGSSYSELPCGSDYSHTAAASVQSRPLDSQFRSNGGHAPLGDSGPWPELREPMFVESSRLLPKGCPTLVVGANSTANMAANSATPPPMSKEQQMYLDYAMLVGANSTANMAANSAAPPPMSKEQQMYLDYAMLASLDPPGIGALQPLDASSIAIARQVGANSAAPPPMSKEQQVYLDYAMLAGLAPPGVSALQPLDASSIAVARQALASASVDGHVFGAGITSAPGLDQWVKGPTTPNFYSMPNPFIGMDEPTGSDAPVFIPPPGLRLSRALGA